MKNKDLLGKKTYQPYLMLNFDDIEKKASKLANIIETHHDQLINILLKYESYEVAEDETSRTLDLLRHIRENEEYFKLRVGPVTSFLPRNQPLYAFSCFVIVPSLMASEVHFRIPHTAKHFFGEMLNLLGISTVFPNIYVSTKERLDFLKERSAVLENPKTGETRPVTDAVIFTGTFANSEKLRIVFDNRTLFISNGSGHNPLVVAEDANLDAAVDAVTTLQFYNQGQDCAAPNAILVHKKISQKFMEILRDKTIKTKVGPYQDRSCRVGPISDPRDLPRLQEFLVENQAWIDASTPGNISTHDSIVAPTIIFKPLVNGGNFQEIFAPIIFVQEYESDEKLKDYFQDRKYAENAMYVTVYGKSTYVENLADKTIGGKILHDHSTLIHNTHLHAPGVERGTQPYGGFGAGASSLSINGKLIAKPTLPQRDIYDWLAQPLLESESVERVDPTQFTQILNRNVAKLLRIKLPSQIIEKAAHSLEDEIYIDSQQVKGNDARYIKIDESKLYTLLKEPNVAYVAMLDMREIKFLEHLLLLLQNRSSLSFEAFESRLYAIPRNNAKTSDNKILQRRFFQDIYQLLFARDEGPRLADFLWSLEENKINRLLAILDIHDR